MGIKKYKPTTPGRRWASVSTYDEVTQTKPERSLVKPIKKTGGRNNHGHVTSRHRGGGHKRLYRVIDFKRNKDGIPAKVATIEYDPNRTAFIALLHYADGEKRYILAPVGLKVGEKVMSGSGADIRPGNSLQLRDIPPGTVIHNVELKPGRGGQIVRSAGSSAQLAVKEGRYALLSMPSGEVRKILLDCKATIGQVSHPDYTNAQLGKAGRSRWLGRRPHVRGVAQNPVDHPMGGGEGRSSGGRHPCSPWGKPAKGGKTRRKKPSDKLIVRSRRVKGRS